MMIYVWLLGVCVCVYGSLGCPLGPSSDSTS
jgi:hypothetical protein